MNSREKSADARQIIGSSEDKRIVMHFVHDVTAGELRDGWKEGFEKNYPNAAAVQDPIDGREFQQAVLSIWLGPHPTNSELKEGILRSLSRDRESPDRGRRHDCHPRRRHRSCSRWLPQAPPEA